MIDIINAILPQTQCRQCGFEGCKPYAEARCAGDAEINRCPPGGKAGVAKLALALGLSEKANLEIDPDCGKVGPRLIAVIDPARCIGCTLCIDACPVDVIIGAAKLMHTVRTADCTGCLLCLPPCPVDCIDMVHQAAFEGWTEHDATAAKSRYDFRNLRLADAAAEEQAKRKRMLDSLRA